MARVLALEPFYGGSHKSFIDGLIERSRHTFHLLTLPPCFWKWRMRGAAITMADKAKKAGFEPDLVLATDMLSLAEFLPLYGRRLPSLLYMHENQLSYPLPEDNHLDVHFGFTNITSCLAATAVIWNSEFHRDEFLGGLPAFVNMMPDHQPARLSERIAAKSEVIFPGIDIAAIDAAAAERSGPPLIVWNHRWEFDKQPEEFFAAVEELEAAGLDFRLAVLGENFQAKPTVFIEAQQKFSHRIVHFGYAQSREDYFRVLRSASVSVSTSLQENFGIAAVEAAYAGARPLWPDRLSYPELLPPEAGRDHLYRDFPELVIN